MLASLGYIFCVAACNAAEENSWGNSILMTCSHLMQFIGWTPLSLVESITHILLTFWSHSGSLWNPFVSHHFSPPARWGLLDFMSVDFRLPPPAASCRRLPPPSAFRRLPPPPDLNHDHPRQVFPAGPQPRPSTPSVPCRTSTATIHAKCSLPDFNRENPRQVFPAGPQPRESTPSVPCRTSTATIHAQCSLPDLNRENPRQVFPAGPQPPGKYVRKIECQIECQIRKLERMSAKYVMYYMQTRARVW